jgi:hypothetical protein
MSAEACDGYCEQSGFEIGCRAGYNSGFEDGQRVAAVRFAVLAAESMDAGDRKLFAEEIAAALEAGRLLWAGFHQDPPGGLVVASRYVAGRAVAHRAGGSGRTLCGAFTQERPAHGEPECRQCRQRYAAGYRLLVSWIGWTDSGGCIHRRPDVPESRDES